MNFYVLFHIIHLIHLSFEISLPYILSQGGDSKEPIVFMRSVESFIMISSKFTSMVLNAYAITGGSFSTELSEFNEYIFSSFVPQIYMGDSGVTLVYFKHDDSANKAYIKDGTYTINICNLDSRTKMQRF